MSELEILYHGEIQILGWGESRARGKYLTIRLYDIEDDPLNEFRGLDIKGDKSLHILNATITRGDILEAEEESVEDFGKIAMKLYINGFFYNPKVLEAIGTDEQYRQWIQLQPSAYSGEFSEWINGDGRCEAAHVRRASDAGTGYKPPYSCIPLTHAEHALQHTQGEQALHPKEWFDKKRADYLVKWAKQTLLKHLGNYSGFREVPPIELKNWCTKHELSQYLPKEYK
jgi:hypothetical protein